MEPLVAIVVHLTSESHPRWEGAVPQGSERAQAGYFVNIADKKDVTLSRCLRASQREECLGVKSVAGEALVFPGVVLWDFLGVRNIENAMDDFVLKLLELLQIVLQVQRLRVPLKCGW